MEVERSEPQTADPDRAARNGKQAGTEHKRNDEARRGTGLPELRRQPNGNRGAKVARFRA